ncbi:MAG: hypothetical protein ACI8QZ_002082 [Chlamydiales bacterium]
MFETKDDHPGRWQRPVRVPARKQDIFGAAKEMCEDLEGWTVLEVDDEALRITCECSNGFLAGTSRIKVWVEGPDNIPSSTTCMTSEGGGPRDRNKANVTEFVKKFTMRVC